MNQIRKVNIGSFGHSGNTALVDFFDSHYNVVSLDGRCTESSFVRSMWGLHGVINNYEKHSHYMESIYIKSLLLGDMKFYHGYEGYKPTDHDFIRNRRVANYLGNEFCESVDSFIKDYQKLVDSSAQLSDLINLFNKFIDNMSSLCVSKSKAPKSSVVIFRNDPAASGLYLAKYVQYYRQVVVVRDPLDIATEWIPFYGYNFDEAGAVKFCKQFQVKVEKFLAEYEDVKERVVLVGFEDFLKSSNTRAKISNLLGLDGPVNCLRFNADQSLMNIGIARRLPAHLLGQIRERCTPLANKLQNLVL